MRAYKTNVQEGNPFGRWTQHRARLAALSREDARNESAELDARQQLMAARLADRILEDREALTPAARERLASLLREVTS